ncbi:hypothetical protein CEE87_13125, partial [Lactobacillus crispatus]
MQPSVVPDGLRRKISLTTQKWRADAEWDLQNAKMKALVRGRMGVKGHIRMVGRHRTGGDHELAAPGCPEPRPAADLLVDAERVAGRARDVG